MADRGNAIAQQGTEIDRHVGARILIRRIQLGISRETFADMLEEPVDLVSRYESGHERPPAPQLLKISHLLRTTLTYLFSDIRPTDRDLILSGSLSRPVT